LKKEEAKIVRKNPTSVNKKKKVVIIKKHNFSASNKASQD